jgi:hypothetical protein
MDFTDNIRAMLAIREILGKNRSDFSPVSAALGLTSEDWHKLLCDQALLEETPAALGLLPPQ